MLITEQRVVQPRTQDGFYQLTVKANGGSVAIAYPVGQEWITAETISLDGAQLISALSPIRITPTGGAAYDLS